jgi:hypothetical protein
MKSFSLAQTKSLVIYLNHCSLKHGGQVDVIVEEGHGVCHMHHVIISPVWVRESAKKKKLEDTEPENIMPTINE